MARTKNGAKVTIDKNIRDKWIRDIALYEKSYVQYYLNVGAKRIYKKATEVIQDYYDDYDPFYYRRTDQQKNKSFQIFNEKSLFTSNGTDKINKEYRSGLIITSEDIFYNRYNKSTGDMFESHSRAYKMGSAERDINFIITSQVWKEGLHGRYVQTKTSPTPYNQLLSLTLDNLGFMNELQNGSTNYAKKQKYNILEFNE